MPNPPFHVFLEFVLFTSLIQPFSELIYSRISAPNLPTSQRYESHLFWSHSSPPSLCWQSHVRSFSHLPSESLPPGAASGATFTSYTVNPSIYLGYLLTRIRDSHHAHFVRASLPMESGLQATISAAERAASASATVTKPFATVFCAGLNARGMVPDGAVFPTRGQTVLVRGEAARARTFEFDSNGRGDELSYVIPRTGSGTSILGGCKQAGKW